MDTAALDSLPATVDESDLPEARLRSRFQVGIYHLSNLGSPEEVEVYRIRDRDLDRIGEGRVVFGVGHAPMLTGPA